MSSLNAIQLPGSLTITGLTIDNSYADVTIDLSHSTTLREQSNEIELDTDIIPEYYIELSGNINQFIDVSLSESADAADDAWSLKQFGTLDSNSDLSGVSVPTDPATGVSGEVLVGTQGGDISGTFTIGANFPDTSGQIDVGQVTVDAHSLASNIDSTDDSPNTFTYFIYPSLSETGLLTFNHGYDDDAKTFGLIGSGEDTTLAQSLYARTLWEKNFTADRTTEDVQEETLGATAADLSQVTISEVTDSSFAADITGLLADVGDTIISELTFNVTSIDPSNGNILSKWANQQEYNGVDTDGDKVGLFKEGQHVWINNSNEITDASSDLVQELALNMRPYHFTNEYDKVIYFNIGVKLVQSSDGARPSA